MNRSLRVSPARYGAACLFALLVAGPLWGQKTGQPSQPSQPSGTQPGANMGSQPSIREAQQPVYVNGRVLMETGQPVPEPVSVGLTCGMRTLQVVHTDSKGYFQFILGAGPQSNVDTSASDDTSMGGLGFPGMDGAFGGAGGNMMGCELQVSVGGYQPLTKTLTNPAEIEGIDAGTLLLRRREGVTGSSISVTSLQVPDSARKEFEKGEKDARSNHLPSAKQHLEKAVALYDKYAAAWNGLGQICLADRDLDGAHQAFEKAIAVDAQYIPPYVSLAALDLQTSQYDGAAETAGKALALDPSIGTASFIQAAADFKLNRLDDAEKGARDAENGPHQNIPQVHVLLAQIFVQKQDYPNAITQLRAYLKEAPRGPFVVEAKKNLDGIEKAQADASNKPNPTAEPPQSAP
jgi:tetratricopeptide (TPR) repeat protein